MAAKSFHSIISAFFQSPTPSESINSHPARRPKQRIAKQVSKLRFILSQHQLKTIHFLQSRETPTPATTCQAKKPRKPNVFIDDEKYAMAKTLVAQNASTMEIARALNVSQMTAWKVRDAIVKGLPLSYRNKRDGRSASNGSSVCGDAAGGAVTESMESQMAHQLLLQQQLQQEQYRQEQLQIQQQHQQQQQQKRLQQQQQERLRLLQR